MQKLAIAFTAVAFMAGSALAIPLSVSIDDNDFTFDTAFDAAYNYNGAAADNLTVAPEGNEVGSYRVISLSVFGLQPGFYPVWGSQMFGGDLVLDMEFDYADGPYNHASGDQYEVSLEGNDGFLEIIGYIGAAPDPAVGPRPLIRIDFERTSLLARAGVDVVDLVEGAGILSVWDPDNNNANGEGWVDTGLTGVTFFKFMPETDPFNPTIVFPDLGVTEYYNPAEDYGLESIVGRVSGEAGSGTFVPEPASMAVLALGAVALIRRRRA